MRKYSQKQAIRSVRRPRPVEMRRPALPEYPVGPHGRMGNEGFMARIGGWSGDLSKKATSLSPATGTARNRPIDDLLDWLNANVKTKQGQRLQTFVHDLKQVELLSKQVVSVVDRREASKVFRVANSEVKLEQTISQIHARIQRTCMRYCLYPSLTWTMWGKWSLGFCTEAQSDEIPVVYKGPSDYGRRVFEGDAAIVVIGIAERGEISRLRACELCGSWFFASANTSHNARKFCKNACRLKYFHERRRREAERR